MEAVKTRSETFDFSRNFDFFAWLLDELDDTAHARAPVWVEDTHCVESVRALDHLFVSKVILFNKETFHP